MSLITNISVTQRQIGVGLNVPIILVLCQKLSTGTADPKEPVLIQTEQDAITKLGAGSAGAYLSKYLFEANKGANETWFFPYEDETGGTQATGSIEIKGTATETKTIEIISFDYKNKKDVLIAKGETYTEISAKIKAQIEKVNKQNLPIEVTETDNAGTDGKILTFTVRNKGTFGNFFNIRISEQVAGVDFILTGYSGGSNDPDISTLKDDISGIRYQFIYAQAGLNDSTELGTFITERRVALDPILDGAVTYARQDTVANLKLEAETLNKQAINFHGYKQLNKDLHKGNPFKDHIDVLGIVNLGYTGRRENPDFDNSDILINPNLVNKKGSVGTVSFPFSGTNFIAYTGIVDEHNNFSLAEKRELQEAGVNYFEYKDKQVVSSKIVTTYQTLNGVKIEEGTAPTTLNYYLQSYRTREIFYRELKIAFPQTAIQESPTAVDGVVDKKTCINVLVRIYQDCVNLGLLNSGEIAYNSFLNEVKQSFEINNGFSFQAITTLLEQIRRIDGTLENSQQEF